MAGPGRVPGCGGPSLGKESFPSASKGLEVTPSLPGIPSYLPCQDAGAVGTPMKRVVKCLMVASLKWEWKGPALGLADNQPAPGFIMRKKTPTTQGTGFLLLGLGESKLSALPNGCLACAVPAPKIHTMEGSPLEEGGHY